MTTPPTTDTLAEQRQQLRAQLAAQRQVLAAKIVAGPPGAYPRSITMRWLIREPALLSTLVTWAIGRRMAAALPVVLSLGRLWRATAHPHPPTQGSP